MDIINIPGAASGQSGRVIKAGDLDPSTDLVLIGSKVNNKRDGTQWAENYIKAEDLFTLIPPPVIVPIPSVITTPIVVGNNQIGLNIGGYSLDVGGSLNIEGNGAVYIL